MYTFPSGSMLWLPYFLLPHFPPSPVFLTWPSAVPLMFSLTHYPYLYLLLRLVPSALIPHFLPLQNVDIITTGEWFTRSIYLPLAPRFLSSQKGHLRMWAPLPRGTCHPTCCRLPSSPPFQQEDCPWTKTSPTPMKPVLPLWATVWRLGRTRSRRKKIWVLQLRYQW